MNRNYRFILVFFVVILQFCTFGFCGELIIFHAGSLAKPLKEICDEFKKIYPDIEIIREASGSREAAFKVAHLHRGCDMVFSSDYDVIEEILIPEYSSWYFVFARNEMVVAFSEWSRYVSEIDAENWHEVLSRDGVRIGRSNENMDPCGYRTLMVWQLAEDLYGEKGLYGKLGKNCPSRNIRPKEIELVSQIESLDMDYIFIYLSIAIQHRLQHIELPDEINLGHFEYRDVYAKAKVKVSGPKGDSAIQGLPIQYAVTIPHNSPNREEAVKFLRFLTTKKAMDILDRNGQPPHLFLKGDVQDDAGFLREYKR